MTMAQLPASLPQIVDHLARSTSILDAVPDFVDLLPIAIYACAADGRILWFNNRAVELWGREPRIGDNAERFCGSHRLYFDGQLVPVTDCPMAVVLRTGLAAHGVEGKIERPDGSSAWAVVYIEPIKDENGSLIGAINCFHETTSLHHQPDELDDFFENAPVSLHLVSRNGTILRANKAELEMLGYSPEEYVGKHIAEFHVEKSAIQDILGRLLRLDEINQYPSRLRCKDGSIKDVVITSNARMYNGQFLNTRCFTVDVTEQKQAQDALARRIEEQAALHDLTARLERANGLGEVYTAALDAITRSLRCERASVLLFDGQKTMRFVAWRWLSDEYRRAVDGHSPWTPETINPSPMVFENIHTADLAHELKRTITKEGIGALAFLPLLEGGRLLGKFMVYYDHPHAFTPAELDIAVTIERQLGFSIERLRASEKVQHFAAIVESSDDAIVSKNLDGIIQSWNRGPENLLGYTAEETIGRPITIIIPPDRQIEEPHFITRLGNGEKIDHFETVRQRKDGRLIDVSLTISPVRDRTGLIIGLRKSCATFLSANSLKTSFATVKSAFKICSKLFLPLSIPLMPKVKSLISTAPRSN